MAHRIALESAMLVIGGVVSGLLFVWWTRPPISAHAANFFSIKLNTRLDLRSALIENHLLAWPAAGFSLPALVLAATGLLGLLSYHVARRAPAVDPLVALRHE